MASAAGRVDGLSILLATMYFPPSAGGGVQRPLKLAQHLPQLGVETHVLTPDDSKWIERDETVPIPPGVDVHYARNVGPATRLRGRELHAVNPVARARVEARNAFRRVLVPDSEVVWALGAIPAALRLVRRHAIDVVVTTSPPDSVHLVGAAVKRATGVPWIADLRDSLVSSPFRRREIRGERLLARLVARSADAVVAVSAGIADEMRALGSRGRVQVIANGCDAEDFDGLEYRPGPRFRITHTGSFLAARDPRPFLEALATADADVIARFVGDLRARDVEHAVRLGIRNRLEVLPFVPRRRALAFQRNSEALLLLVGKTNGRSRGVVTGKVYEYLVAGRPILAAVPPASEAAELVTAAGAGLVVSPDDVQGLAAALAEFVERWRARELARPPLPAPLVGRLSRRAVAERFTTLAAEVARR